MPSRRLPTTILSRENVLSDTNEKLKTTPPEKRAISDDTVARLENIYPRYRKEVGDKNESLSKQAKLSKEEDVQQEILTKYVSHFFQVFQFGVDRGKYSVTDRAYYGLDVNQSELPILRSEKDLIAWSKNLVDGEPRRLEVEGSEPMQNPEIKEISTELNKYLDIHNRQSAEKDAFDKENKDILNMLPQVDDLIRDIYDEVEFHFRKETPSNKRKLAREWGVIYITRKGETPEEGTIEEEELYSSELV